MYFNDSISQFEFYGNDSILACNENKNRIFQYNFDPEPKEDLKIKDKNNPCFIYKEEYHFFSICNNYFLIQSNDKTIKIFDNFDNLIYSIDNLPLNNIKIINSTNESIILKLLDIDKNNNVNLIIIKDLYNEQEKEVLKGEEKQKKISKNDEDEEDEEEKSEYNSIDNSFENLDKDFFENCPNIFMDIQECLSSEYNKYDDINKKEKKYLEINEIKLYLEKGISQNLIHRSKFVKNELEKIEIKKFKSIKEEYMFYLKLLINDETNIKLLKKYLLFLKKNETMLEKEELPYEKFYDELRYYSVFFEKKELKENFGCDFESEKIKLINLLECYSSSISNNNFQQ